MSVHEQALFEKAKPKSDSILEQHHQFPDLASIPKASFGEQAEINDELKADIRRKRLIYRAKQRGWLEVDLLLGTWANQFVPTLSTDELDQFEEFVNAETIDIYNIITLRTDIPQELSNPIVERIQQWAKANPLGKADPEEYRKVKEDANLI